MRSNLITRLIHESDTLISVLDHHPVASRLFEGVMSTEEYASFLTQTFQYVRWSRSLLISSSRRLRVIGRNTALADLLRVKAGEESAIQEDGLRVGHEAWVVTDLEAIGVLRSKVLSAPVSAPVAAYIRWNLFTAQSDHPEAFLGTAFMLERLASARGARSVANLIERSPIPNIERAVSFLKHHGELDDGHVEHLTAVLNGVSSSAEQEAILHSAQTFRFIYPGIFSGARRLARRSRRR
jgi:pyrroloquinoline quinone (PQQ) biosynthesis protein C